MIVGALAIVAFVILGSALDRSTVVSGPNGSSYVTTGNGTAAFYEVLAEVGRSPTRLVTRLDDDALEPIETLMIIEPGLTAYGSLEVDAIEQWITDGGRLVVVGRPPADLDELTSGGSQRWSTATVDNPQTFLPEGLVSDTRRFGSFDPADGLVNWLVDDSRIAATVAPLGDGWVVMIADLGVISNDGLGVGDNARIAVSLAGDGPVGFDEVRHGFEDADATGIIDAAPGNWQGALILLAVAVVAGLVTYGRRFGPPEPSRLDLIPGRGAFIDSVGDALAATGRVAAITDPIRQLARRKIRARAASDDPDDLVRAARSLGLTEIEFNAVYDDGESTAYLAQDALARLHQTKREDQRE
jgi:hypothetical protein